MTTLTASAPSPAPSSSPARRDDPTGPAAARGSVETLLVLAATLVLLGGFGGLFRGVQWYVVVALLVVLVATVSLLVRLRRPAWGTPAGALAGFVALVWTFAPGSTFWAIPTPGSIAALGAQVQQASRVIIEEAAPIRPPDSVILVVAIAFTILFVLGDAVARQTWRVPLLGALWTSVLIVPGIIAATMPAWWVFAGTAAVWLALWWFQTAHAPTRPPAVAVVTGLGAVVAALVLPLLTPTIEPVRPEVDVAGDEIFGRGINPMVELGRSLRQSSSQRVLTYTTDSTAGVYLKVASLRRFNGRTWSPNSVLTDDEIEGTETFPPGVEVTDVSTRIRIDALRSSLLPVPYPATEIRGLTGTWRWLRDGSTVRATGSTSTTDQTYTVTSLDRRPTAEQLRALEPASAELDSYRALPDDVPFAVSRAARERAGDADNDYDRMLRLQDWMRDNFTYSVEAPVEEGYDGDGLDVMAEFLERERGYCVHFASALAVMGRVLGVPTRVAIGYAPGGTVVRRTNEGTTYALNSDDLHAWTEAYFPDVGWIPFDATPGVGDATAFEEPEDAATPDDQVADPAAEDETDAQTLNPEDDAAASATAEGSGASWRAAALAGGVVLVLITLPGAWRLLRRRRRWREGRDSAEPLWAEVADTALDLGIGADEAETPRGFAQRLAGAGVDPDRLEVLLADLERTRYGGQRGLPPRVDEARHVVDSMERSQTRRARWLARFVPRSLLAVTPRPTDRVPSARSVSG